MYFSLTLFYYLIADNAIDCFDVKVLISILFFGCLGIVTLGISELHIYSLDKEWQQAPAVSKA